MKWKKSRWRRIDSSGSVSGVSGAFEYHSVVGQGEINYGGRGSFFLALLIPVGGKRSIVLRRGLGDGAIHLGMWS